MRQRVVQGPQDSVTELEPRVPQGVESDTALALDRTLAIPTETRLRSAAPIAGGDAVELGSHPPDQPCGLADSTRAGGLRAPIACHHYSHAYSAEATHHQELGRGGIGRVVLVLDRTLGREVAMKELLPELITENATTLGSDDANLTQRFLREARITGQLEHPNIVPVYELGLQPSGCLYYTMRVVRGRTLASAIREAANLADRLTLVNHFSGLCQAIAYAHSRGVVHRDIKPENVMIGEFGETFVLDWGLANIVEDASPQSLRGATGFSAPPESLRCEPPLAKGTAETFHTQYGSIVGTPQYMSPEQLLQRTSGCATTSDVWALGVVLYEILTGKQPFAATTWTELIFQIENATYARIEDLAPEAPRDLSAIACRALARDPRLRYRNGREMARDIAAYQAGGKVRAYDYSSVELLRRFVRRNRAALGVGAAALTTLVGLGVSSYVRVSAARDAAILAEKRAVFGEQQAKSSLSDVLVERARSELSEGDTPSASLLAAGALELMERPDARGILLSVANLDRLEPLVIPRFPEHCQFQAWNPTLVQLACLEGRTLTVRDIRTSALMRLDTGAPAQHLHAVGAAGWLLPLEEHSAQILGADGSSLALPLSLGPRAVAAASPDGSCLAIGDATGKLEIWSVSPAALLRSARWSHPITALSFDATSTSLASGSHRGDLLLWHWQDEAAPRQLGNTRSTVRSLAFSPKENLLISGGSDGSLLVWDTLQRQLVMAPVRATSAVVSLSFTSDGTSLAVAMRSGIVDVLDPKTYERMMRSTTGSNAIQQALFTSNSELVGTSEDSTPLRFLVRRAEPRARYASRSNVLALSSAHNGLDLLVAGLGEHGLCHLRLVDGRCTDRLPLRTDLVRRVKLSNDGRLILVAGSGGRVEVWDAQLKIPRGFVEVPIREVRDLAFLPGSDLVAIGGNQPTLVLLDPLQMRIVEQTTLPGPVQSMALLPQTKQLALGLRNGQILFRGLDSGKLEGNVQVASGWPVGMAGSERHGWLAIAEDNGLVSFLDLKSKRIIDSVTTGSGRVTSFAFDESDDLLAIGGENREIQIISTTEPPSILARMDEHQGTVRSLLFDVTNQRLFSAGDDGIVRLWSLAPLKKSATLLRKTAETAYGIRLESGRIVRDRIE